jgi:hypothetical protein
MPERSLTDIILSGLPVIAGVIGLGTAALGLLRALGERQIKKADQSLPDSSFEFLNIKREPPVPRVSDRRLRYKAYRNLGLQGAIFLTLGLVYFLYSGFVLYKFPAFTDSSLLLAVSIINELLALAYLNYGFFNLRSFIVWRKSPLDGPSKACQKAFLEIVADHFETINRSMTALRRTGAQIIEVSSQCDECLIRAVHYKGHLMRYYDELAITIRSRTEKDHQSVEIEVDGLRPTFRPDRIRNLLTINKLVNEII